MPKIYSQEEVQDIYKQLTEVKHQDGTPVFQVSIEPGMYGCYIKLANQDTVGNLYFRLLPPPVFNCNICEEVHEVLT
jgi:hypothetical protein